MPLSDGADAVTLSVREVAVFERPFRLRMPFRFGAVTVTQGRQAIARVRIELRDGRTAWGVAAESLAAKWFDKNPALSDAENIDQLRRALELAAEAYRTQSAMSAFGHFTAAYPELVAAGAREGLDPLVASFGPALLDRCILDALGKLLSLSFWSLMERNLGGIQSDKVAPDLARFDLGSFLAALRPSERIAIRHTVGMADPLTAADLDARDRPNDELPATLEEVIATHRPSYFKLKVSGDIAADIDRLEAIAAVLDRKAGDYRARLDGNEQFQDAASVLAWWREIAASAPLARLRAAVLFIEQPIQRRAALTESVGPLAERRPVIIDESDGDFDAFPRARACGYTGVSSKTCKGLYKSIINMARCAMWNAEISAARFFMSGEDLTTLAGIAVQQDFALVALLGLRHVERNGHHFVDGMRGRPSAEQETMLAAHPGLYEKADGTVRLCIRNGAVDLGSLSCPGFAAPVEPDWSSLVPMPPSRWVGSRT